MHYFLFITAVNAITLCVLYYVSPVFFQLVMLQLLYFYYVLLQSVSTVCTINRLRPIPSRQHHRSPTTDPQRFFAWKTVECTLLVAAMGIACSFGCLSRVGLAAHATRAVFGVVLFQEVVGCTRLPSSFLIVAKCDARSRRFFEDGSYFCRVSPEWAVHSER